MKERSCEHSRCTLDLLLGGCLPLGGRLAFAANAASSESELSGALGLALAALVFFAAFAFTLALSGTSSSLSSISDFGALSGVEAAAVTAPLAMGTSSDITFPLDGEWITSAATCFAGAARGTSSSEDSDLASLRFCGLALVDGFFGEDGEDDFDPVVFVRLT